MAEHCPHCRADLPAVGDAVCPACRRPRVAVGRGPRPFLVVCGALAVVGGVAGLWSDFAIDGVILALIGLGLLAVGLQRPRTVPDER